MAEVSSEAKTNAERLFLERLSAIIIEPIELERVLSALYDWREVLVQRLDKERGTLSCEYFTEQHPVFKGLAQLNQNSADFSTRWAAQWQERHAAQDLARYFDDKLMFLVYGKFNAGKSSFCNFIAERFLSQGHEVEFFTVQQGEITPISGPFKEGSTETTAEIQGLILSGRMVLLDTPGLHSLTEENAALTRQFLESADGMLWLSSSTSPGQVQELDTLAQELRRRKPLLPVITRSDFVDEDIIDNQIVKIVCNKTTENRDLQEEDLRERAIEKLQKLGVDPEVLKPAVSISVYAAKAQTEGVENSAELEAFKKALSGAGFYRFYEALSELLPSMQLYKQRKPAELLLHHLEEDVREDVLAFYRHCEHLQSEIQEEIQAATKGSERWAKLVWQQCAADIPELLDEQIKAEGSVMALSAALTNKLNKQLIKQAERVFPAYQPVLYKRAVEVEQIIQVLARFSQVSLDNYEAIYKRLDQEVQSISVEIAKELADLAADILNELQEKLAQVQKLVHNSIQDLEQIRLQLVNT